MLQDFERVYHYAGCLAIFLPEEYDVYNNGIPDGSFDPFILGWSRANEIGGHQYLE